MSTERSSSRLQLRFLSGSHAQDQPENGDDRDGDEERLLHPKRSDRERVAPRERHGEARTAAYRPSAMNSAAPFPRRTKGAQPITAITTMTSPIAIAS